MGLCGCRYRLESDPSNGQSEHRRRNENLQPEVKRSSRRWRDLAADDVSSSDCPRREGLPKRGGVLGVARRWMARRADCEMTIKKEGSRYVVRSESGKNLGKSSTKAGAKKRLRQVEYFKHKQPK